jgi:hypothetical protein
MRFCIAMEDVYMERNRYTTYNKYSNETIVDFFNLSREVLVSLEGFAKESDRELND